MVLWAHFSWLLKQWRLECLCFETFTLMTGILFLIEIYTLQMWFFSIYYSAFSVVRKVFVRPPAIQCEMRVREICLLMRFSRCIRSFPQDITSFEIVTLFTFWWRLKLCRLYIKGWLIEFQYMDEVTCKVGSNFMQTLSTLLAYRSQFLVLN